MLDVTTTKIDCQDTAHAPIRTAPIDLAFDHLIATLAGIRRPLAHVLAANADDLREFSDHYRDVASAAADYLRSLEEYVESVSDLDLGKGYLMLNDLRVDVCGTITNRAETMEYECEDAP